MVRLIVVFFWLMASPAWSATYYVATTGSNSNSCTQAQNEATPKLTLPAGVGCLTGGDTLIIAAGTYTNQNILNPPAGAEGAHTIIRGSPDGARPVIAPNGGTFDNPGVTGFDCTNGSSCHHITLEYVEISFPYRYIRLFGTDTIGYPHHVHFINNVFHDSVGTGANASTSSSGNLGGDHLYRGNEFYRTGQGHPGYGPGHNTIYNPGNRSIVEHNTFHNLSNAVGIWGGVSSIDIRGVTVRHNVCYEIGRSNTDTWQQGNGSFSCVHVSANGGGHSIHHNVIYNSCDQSTCRGIRIWRGNTAGAGTNRVDHNTIYDMKTSGAAGILLETSAGPTVVRNNLVRVSGVAISSGGTQSNNITTGVATDLWTSPSTYDLTLKAGSAAINAGVDIGELFSGSSPDVGAFETAAPPTFSMTTNLITGQTDIVNTPLQSLSTAGLSVACTPNPTACPASPAISSVTRRPGTDTQPDIVISGISGDACATGQDWTLSYNSSTGQWTDFANIGAPPGLRQKILSFTNVAVTNNCTGSGPPSTIGTPYIAYAMNEGSGTTLTNTGSLGASGDGTLTNSPVWVSGHSGSGLQMSGSQQVDVPYGNAVNPTTQSITFVIPVFVPAGLETAALYPLGAAFGTDQRAYICGIAGTWRMATQTVPCSGTGAAPVSNLAVTAGWNFLTWVFDSATDTATLYKDGVAGTGGATRAITSYTFASNFTLGHLPTNLGFGGTYDDFSIYTSVESASALYAAWNAPPPVTGTFSQTAVQFEDVYRPSIGGGPTILASPNNTKQVVQGGAVAVVVQIECDDCDQTSFRIAAKDNGAGDWLQIPNTQTASNLYMWGTGGQEFLNNFFITSRVLENGCALSSGATILTASQIPQVTLPADGCVVLRYLIRVSPTATGYTEIRAEKQGGVEFTGTYVLGRIDITNPQATGVGF